MLLVSLPSISISPDIHCHFYGHWICTSRPTFLGPQSLTLWPVGWIYRRTLRWVMEVPTFHQDPDSVTVVTISIRWQFLQSCSFLCRKLAVSAQGRAQQDLIYFRFTDM